MESPLGRPGGTRPAARPIRPGRTQVYGARVAAPLTPETIRSAPKVLLHDHLDGGLRAGTVVDLADAVGYGDLPTRDPEELAGWFLGAAHSGSLERYLETFGHTVAVMQT